MSTRGGELDPGVLLYLLDQRGLDVAGLSHLVNKESGLHYLGMQLDRERNAADARVISDDVSPVMARVIPDQCGPHHRPTHTSLDPRRSQRWPQRMTSTSASPVP